MTTTAKIIQAATKPPSAQQVAVMKNNIKKMLGTKLEVPEGHVIAMAHARVMGRAPQKLTPHGEPILISSVFDLTTETPQSAIARAAFKWHKIQPNPAHWEIEFEADVRTDLHPAHPPIAYSKVFHLIFLPELPMMKHKGLDHATMPNHFLNSYYLNITYDKFNRVKPKEVN